MNDIDQEEHRLAALAAGYKVKRDRDMDTDFLMDEDRVVAIDGQWSPKTDKADNFDLMTTCNIIAGFSKKENKAIAVHPYTDIKCETGGHDTPADDLMQAIFNCAAAVGITMEEINEQAAD